METPPSSASPSPAPSPTSPCGGRSVGPSALDDIPLEPEQISREWLFEVINQFRRSRGLSALCDPDDILDCSIDECDRSHGYLSTTYKLVANFKCHAGIVPNESSYSFFLKMLPGLDPRQRRLVRGSRAFAREVEAHFSLLPAMRLFVEENDSANGRRGGRVWGTRVPLTPQIVYGAYDDRDGAGIVALMDLNDTGFYPLNHYGGFNVAQLVSVAEKVAEFHAVGSAMLMRGESDGEEDVTSQFKVFQEAPLDSDFLYDMLGPIFKDLGKFLRRVPGFAFCYTLMEKERPNLVPLLSKLSRRRSRFPLRTVLHGELWEKNLLLRLEPISDDLEVVLCDWKAVRVAPSPADDLAFLVLACSSQTTRERGLQSVLEAYFTAYAETLCKFNIDFAKRFPKFKFEDFVQDFEDALLGAFLQVSIVMIREVRYLEAEFYNATENSEIEEFGRQLRSIGRRLLELCERFVPELEARRIREEQERKQQKCIINKQASLGGRNGGKPAMHKKQIGAGGARNKIKT